MFFPCILKTSAFIECLAGCFYRNPRGQSVVNTLIWPSRYKRKIILCRCGSDLNLFFENSADQFSQIVEKSCFILRFQFQCDLCYLQSAYFHDHVLVDSFAEKTDR